MTRARIGFGMVALGALLLLGSMTIALGQHRIHSGRALDASLQIGSGGYNRPTGGGHMQRSRYSVGSSRSLYTVRRDGSMRYNPNSAFAPRSRYVATGPGGGLPSSAYHRRFRYTGQYR